LSPAKPISQKKGRILVVDDEAVVLKIFERFLTKAGYVIDTAMNGKEALKLIESVEYSLITLDQMMPEMNGLEFLEAMKKTCDKIPPVVMVTAAHTPELARSAIELGAAACISKPVNKQKITYLANLYTGAKPLVSLQDGEIETSSCMTDRVLLVDNDPLTRDIVELMLTHSGYQVKSVAQSDLAEKATETEYYDLILIDMKMNDLSGERAIRNMHRNNPYTPIIVTTASPSKAIMQQAISAGATSFVKRPVEVYQLLDEIKKMMQIFREK
ncbi:MAG: response regulator, partial [Planctomycetes bacterium]|nr:response regulator [Planctomycetota bacterium]